MISVTILGNNSALANHGRHPTAQIVTGRNSTFLLDCGEGTSMQMKRYDIKAAKVDHVLISHLHGDHYFGLAGLLNYYRLSYRERPLHVYAPEMLEAIINLQMRAAGADLYCPLHFHPLGKNGRVMETDDLTVDCFQVKHGIPCWGFLFREKHGEYHVDAEKALSMGVPRQALAILREEGQYVTDSGRRITLQDIAVEALPPTSYAYTADTIYDPGLCGILRGVDLLYHDSTYQESHRHKAMATGHSTAMEAARIAKEASVGKLLLGHYSSRYVETAPFQQEAASIFPHVEASMEGVTYPARG